jgi:signal peptidase I
MDTSLLPPARTRTPPSGTSASAERWVLAPAEGGRRFPAALRAPEFRVPRPRVSLATGVFFAVVLAAGLAWAMALRPQSLGGPVNYVMVQGVSMEPTFHTGDLVLAWPADPYLKGDIVAYRVPEGDVGAGSIVLHRIVGGSAREGFVMQGDNNPVPDDWHPRPGDILGKARVRIPKLGTVFTFLHAPVPFASLAMGIAVALILVPDDRKRRRRRGPKGQGDGSGS